MSSRSNTSLDHLASSSVLGMLLPSGDTRSKEVGRFAETIRGYTAAAISRNNRSVRSEVSWYRGFPVPTFNFLYDIPHEYTCIGSHPSHGGKPKEISFAQLRTCSMHKFQLSCLCYVILNADLSLLTVQLRWVIDTITREAFGIVFLRTRSILRTHW